MGRWKVRERGNVANILITGIFMLTMTVLMMRFLDEMQLIQQKVQVNQLARRFILRMETTGGLLLRDREDLEQELAGMGVTAIDLSGTTFEPSGYGARIVLQIRGRLGGTYDFEEKRVSTAKY